jgi:hypothetical protein
MTQQVRGWAMVKIMNLTYTVAGLVMFLATLVATLWSHSIVDQCGSIINYIMLSLTNKCSM